MSAPHDPRLDYDEVRARLIDRGYLEGPIERFMLGGWGANAGRSRPGLIRMALKAAVLGAPVLAALVALTVARANPLAARSDFPLLWLYFTPVCALGLFVLAVLVAWINAFLVARFRIRGSAATRAALLAGLPALLYLLTLSATRQRAEGFWLEAIFFAVGLLAIVFVSWLAGLVSVSEVLRRTGRIEGRRGRSLRAVVALLLLAMAGFTWARIAWSAPQPESRWPDFATREAPPILVVGVDGLDGGWLESLESSGAMDRLMALLASGAVLPLRRDPSQQPPSVWMSAMTGRAAADHGLRHVGMERIPGVVTPIDPAAHGLPLDVALRFLLPSRTVPSSGATRRVRAAWEILGHRRSTLAIGWWGSWPAQDEGDWKEPWVVTDRVLTKLLDGATPDRDTWPDALYPRLAAEFDAFQTAKRAEFDDRFAAISANHAKILWESFLIDAFRLDTAQNLATRSGGFDACFVYLPGLDILRQRLEAEAGSGQLLGVAQVLEAYSRWLDEALGVFLAELGTGATTVLIADPGRAARPGSEGFVALVGAAVTRGCVEPGARDPRIVAPLVLALAGFPVSAEMPALEGLGCLDRKWVTAPVLPGYGTRDLSRRLEGSEYDEEMLRRLRSLGYLN